MNENKYLHTESSPRTTLGTSKGQNKTYLRQRGQTTILIALAMLVLMAIVGLAIDGGAAYQQRRVAQNSADAAAIAGTRVMLDAYMQMVRDYPDGDINGSPETDQAIRDTMNAYLTLHHVDPSTLEAYYVDDNKHVVGDGDTLLEVGQFHLVPWLEGARGIWVKDRAQTDTFFMKVFGWTTIGAKANSTAFMGPAIDSASDIGMFPIGFFTDTLSYENMEVGQNYTLINGDSRLGPGNWGFIDYSGNGGSAPINEAWMHCGFNPTVTTNQQWNEWADSQDLLLGNDCASYRTSYGAQGPAAMYKCANADTDPTCSAPQTNAISATYLKFGAGTNGWWVGGSTGTTNSQCQDLADLVNGTTGYDFNVPIIDNWIGGGTGERYHLRAIGRFHIDSADVDCHATNGGGGGEHAQWYINGTYEGLYMEGGTGHHGDLRHTSANTVFLDN